MLLDSNAVFFDKLKPKKTGKRKENTTSYWRIYASVRRVKRMAKFEGPKPDYERSRASGILLEAETNYQL